MHDVIIIGKGPAGISAALYTIRAGLNTLILGHGEGALAKAERIENYYGLPEAVTGPQLALQGEKQIEKFGGKLLKEEVFDISWSGHFGVKTSSGSYEGRTVLLATGAPVIRVPIKNLTAFEGHGVSYCTTCDGFFHRGKPVGVIGYNDYGVHEATELLAFTDRVNFFTNGKDLELSESSKCLLEKLVVVRDPIETLYGEEALRGVQLQDGRKIPLTGFFVAYGSASGATFALKLGIEMAGPSIKVDEHMATNVPGLFAAGDVTGGFKQVSVAVGQGAIAGRYMIEYARKERE